VVLPRVEEVTKPVAGSRVMVKAPAPVRRPSLSYWKETGEPPASVSVARRKSAS
jgi:hypothetical protein